GAQTPAPAPAGRLDRPFAPWRERAAAWLSEKRKVDEKRFRRKTEGAGEAFWACLDKMDTNSGGFDGV
ncbi:MAG: hypothetical protein ACRD4E_02900, partial [Bryobacteraceae bacterium]